MRSVKAFNVVPKELFRANIGPTVILREATVRPKGTFDIFVRDGMVHPNSLDPKKYICMFSLFIVYVKMIAIM